MIQKEYSSSLSPQSSETKPSTKLQLVLILASEEPLLYLEFNKSNEQNVSETQIYFKNSTSPSLKINVGTLTDVRNETSKHHFLKSVKINT